MAAKTKSKEKVRPCIFTCTSCDKGIVTQTASDGRFFEHTVKQVWINLPATFLLPRCNHCKQGFFRDDDLRRLKEVMQSEFDEHKDLIMEIIENYRAEVVRTAP